jgi:membrane protein DedA with SNARE-associated domain
MHNWHLSLALAANKLGDVLRGLAFTLDGPGMLLVALVDSSFLSMPEVNDFLIVLLSIGKSAGQVAFYVLMTTVGSVAGCTLLYSVGRKGGNPLLRKKFSERTVERAAGLYRKYGVLTVVVPSILPPPCPFKIFVFSAGVFRLSAPAFVSAVALGRTIRYSFWGALSFLYGESVRSFMKDNLHQIGIVLFALLLMALAAAVVWYIRNERNSGGQA